ncbi:MAG: DUF928 domain-containing protein [Gammaproteobacteria bacterium]|nr:DUF928 domain-containing protein [Gammaproteobacteria bacterium]
MGMEMAASVETSELIETEEIMEEEERTEQEAEESMSFPKLIAPLAPQHTGFTITPRPVLYWYFSEPWAGEIEFTLNEVDADKPLFRAYLPPPSHSGRHAAGIHRLRLSDHGVRLTQNIEYEWFVAIVPDSEQRSGDLLASGTIRHFRPSGALTERLNKTPENRRHVVYAEEGIWYDAIDLLSSRIDKHPENKALRKQRAALSKQVKMSKVALYDLLYFSGNMQPR